MSTSALHSHACCCQRLLRQLLHLPPCRAAAAAAAAAAALLAQLAHLQLRQLLDGVALHALADLACHITYGIQILERKQQRQKQQQSITLGHIWHGRLRCMFYRPSFRIAVTPYGCAAGMYCSPCKRAEYRLLRRLLCQTPQSSKLTGR